MIDMSGALYQYLRGIRDKAAGREWSYYGFYRGKSITMSEDELQRIDGVLAAYENPLRDNTAGDPHESCIADGGGAVSGAGRSTDKSASGTGQTPASSEGKPTYRPPQLSRWGVRVCGGENRASVPL